MAYTTINKHTDYFRTKAYTGNGTNDTAITFDESSNMQPDFVWIKNRSASQSHAIFDSVRGATKRVTANGSGGESTENTNLDSFDTNGFTVDNEAIVNGSGNNMVGWCWKGGTTSGIATDGESDITPTAYSFNQTSGFSIVKYTGTGTSGEGVPHGLGKKPQFYMVKRLDTTGSWQVYWQPGINISNATKYMILNSTWGENTNTNRWQGYQPDTTNFYLGNSTEVNASGGTYIAYVFANITGFSKAGQYQGSGLTSNSPFIYTGFAPTFVMIKSIANSSLVWNIRDTKRNTDGNPNDRMLYPSSNEAENAHGANNVDLLSNGFKIRTSNGHTNASNAYDYLYLAFGQSLVGSNNVPCTAR